MNYAETENYIYCFNDNLPGYTIDYEPGIKTPDDILMALIAKYGGTIKSKTKKR